MSETVQTLDRLNARLVLAAAIGDALAAAGDDANPPAWVYVYREQVEAIREAAEALELALRPLLPGDNGAPLAGGRTPDQPVPGSLAASTQPPSSSAFK